MSRYYRYLLPIPNPNKSRDKNDYANDVQFHNNFRFAVNVLHFKNIELHKTLSKAISNIDYISHKYKCNMYNIQ